MARFIKDRLANQVTQVQLLSFRRLEVEKYEALGLKYGMDGFKIPPREVWENNILFLVEIMAQRLLPGAVTKHKLIF